MDSLANDGYRPMLLPARPVDVQKHLHVEWDAESGAFKVSGRCRAACYVASAATGKPLRPQEGWRRVAQRPSRDLVNAV